MFRANQNCLVHVASGKTDVYGMPLPGLKYKERCAVIKMNIKSAKSAVRADTSATRGNAQELETDTVLLMNKNTRASIDDNIEMAGHQFRVNAIQPRYDLLGALDHFEIGCTYWAGA